MAFRGMNPEIEKMMENEKIRKEELESAKKETEVNDDEMAEFYHSQSLNRTIGRKFASKRSRTEDQKSEESSNSGNVKKRKKFMKPAQD